MNRKVIYVISTDSGAVKIGVSEYLSERLKNLKISVDKSCKIEFFSSFVDNPFDVERVCHKKLSSFRLIGEWFECSVLTAVSVVKGTIQEIGVVSEVQKPLPPRFSTVDSDYCEYINCNNKIENKKSKGRKKRYCSNNCRRMAGYYKSKKGK